MEPRRDEHGPKVGAGDNSFEGLPAAIDRERHDAEAGADGAEVGGDEKRAVFGEQADPVGWHQALGQQTLAAAAGRGAEFAVRDSSASDQQRRGVGLAAGEDGFRQIVVSTNL